MPNGQWILDDFILGIALALQSSETEVQGYSRFVIISDSPVIIRRYSAAMQTGQPLSVWEKNGCGHWIIEKTIKVPTWLINKVDFQLIES